VSRNIFRSCKACLEALDTPKHTLMKWSKANCRRGKGLQVDVGFLYDKAAMKVAMLRATMKWTHYICIPNTQQGKIGFDCSAISNVNRLLLSFFLSLLFPSFLS
jgi:SH3-like domain-containing protein